MALGSALWSTTSNPALSSKCSNRLTAQEIAEPAWLALLFVCFFPRLISCKEIFLAYSTMTKGYQMQNDGSFFWSNFSKTSGCRNMSHCSSF